MFLFSEPHQPLTYEIAASVRTTRIYAATAFTIAIYAPLAFRLINRKDGARQATRRTLSAST
jgi:hypothetical protein